MWRRWHAIVFPVCTSIGASPPASPAPGLIKPHADGTGTGSWELDLDQLTPFKSAWLQFVALACCANCCGRGYGHAWFMPPQQPANLDVNRRWACPRIAPVPDPVACVAVTVQILWIDRWFTTQCDSSDCPAMRLSQLQKRLKIAGTTAQNQSHSLFFYILYTDIFNGCLSLYGLIC